MRRRATIKDVAALAGASLKTVSRVINAEPGVSPELTLRVEQAVAQLDYRHHRAASDLRRGQRSGSIGVLLHDPRNSFSATLLHSIEAQVRPRGIAVFSASLEDEDAREATLAGDLISRRVDGLVIMPTGSDQSYLVPDVRAGLAVVAVDRVAAGLAVDTVLSDNAGGAHRATTHLLRRGHRRIACLADLAAVWTSVERVRGYREALADAGAPPAQELVVQDLQSPRAAAEATAALLTGPHPPTALFTARNDLTIGALSTLHRLGASDRVALVGFDDFALADVVDPPVTVVAQDVEAIGARVAELLLTRLDGGAEAPQRVVLPTRLVVRGSGEVLGPAPAA